MKKLSVILAEAAMSAKPKGKAYLVIYRLADRRTAHGTYQERYDALVAKLEKLPAVLRRGHFEDEAHIATSSWLVRSLAGTAAVLGQRLSRGLTPGTDLLEVLPVVHNERYELTVEPPKAGRK